MSIALVIDASVAAKWLFKEPDQGLALSLIGGFGLIAPDLLLVECGNVILRRHRLREVPASAAPRLLGRLRAGPIRLHPAAGLVERAVVLAVALGHPIYDCMYMSLAFASLGHAGGDLRSALLSGCTDLSRLRVACGAVERVLAVR